MPEPLHGSWLALRAVYETLAISAPTVLDGARSVLTVARSDARLRRWSARMLALADVTLSVSGTEHLAPHGAYVLMSNHQSHYDVPTLFQALPLTLRMVAKTELFQIPLFGPALRESGFIELDRADRARAIASLALARERLAGGISIWIAPEGTRSRTGELLPFKKGGFMLALETGLPVVPIGIAGTRDVLAAHGRAIRRGARVHVAVGTPIPPPAAGVTTEARDALLAAVRAAIERAMTEARARVARAA